MNFVTPFFLPPLASGPFLVPAGKWQAGCKAYFRGASKSMPFRQLCLLPQKPYALRGNLPDDARPLAECPVR